MSFTREYAITNAGWTILVASQPSAFLQLQDDGPVYVHAGPTIPDPGVYTGLELDRLGLMELSFEGMDASTSIWARSRQDETNRLVVFAGGDDPGPPA